MDGPGRSWTGTDVARPTRPGTETDFGPIGSGRAGQGLFIGRVGPRFLMARSVSGQPRNFSVLIDRLARLARLTRLGCTAISGFKSVSKACNREVDGYGLKGYVFLVWVRDPEVAN